MNNHSWSGWPGAYCVHCGCNDPGETLLICPNYDIMADIWYDQADEAKWREENKIGLGPCPEPGSNRHNPYIKREEKGNE
jgi:hypothetical protein